MFVLGQLRRNQTGKYRRLQTQLLAHDQGDISDGYLLKWCGYLYGQELAVILRNPEEEEEDRDEDVDEEEIDIVEHASHSRATDDGDEQDEDDYDEAE